MEHENNIYKVLNKLNATDTQKEIVSRALYELQVQAKKTVLKEIKNKVESKILSL